MQFWVQDVKPAWLPEGFQVPPEMLNHVQELCKEAEIAYYQTDKDKNGFLRRREFKKAMKYLGINKHEARHMLIFIDRERLKVVSIKNYVNAYLFIKSGGLNHINTDYQGPITTGPDNRTHMKIAKEKMEQLESLPFNPAEFFLKAIPQTLSFPYIAQNVFQSVPRPFPVRAVIGFSATLQAWNGCYVCSENGRVIANRTVVGPWERFWYMSDPDWGLDQYVDMRGFKTYWNTYLCCENLGGIVDNRTSVGLWEKFKAIDPSFDTRQKAFAFKTWDDRYLTVQDDGIVGAVSTLGPKEVFILQYVGDY